MMPNKEEKKRIIILTGGAGSGKTRVLDILRQEYGAAVLQTDVVAKELEEPGQPGYEAMVNVFGRDILNEDGYLDKKILVRMVFGDKAQRERINGLIHPLVWERMKQWIEQSDSRLVVVESALLPENPHEIFHEVWYVHTAKEDRISRMMENRGYSRERGEQMIAGQPTDEVYRQYADHVIDNNGTREELVRQVQTAVRINSSV